MKLDNTLQEIEKSINEVILSKTYKYGKIKIVDA